jgi:hypothetical protein
MDLIPSFFALFGKRSNTASNLGIVSKNIEATKILFCCCNHSLHLIFLRYIAKQRDLRCAKSFSKPILFTADDSEHDICTLAHEEFGHRLTHTRVGTGNNRYLAFQPHH